MEMTLKLPADVFDVEFTEDAFRERVRELAILEPVHVRRLHEHQARQMPEIKRWKLVERMKSAGIVPTENAFEEIKGGWTKRSRQSDSAERGARPHALEVNTDASAAYDAAYKRS